MYDIDICYKLIFESMLERGAVWHLAEKIREYTKADLFFLSENGKILAYSCCGSWESMESVKGKHIIWDEYAYFFEERPEKNEYRVLKEVYSQKMIVGYILLRFQDEKERKFYEELSEILAETEREYFEKAGTGNRLGLSLMEAIKGWSVFEGKLSVQSEKELPEGPYRIGIFDVGKNKVQELTGKLKNLFEICFLEEAGELYVLFCRVEKEWKHLYAELEKMKAACCIGIPFEDIQLCREKREMLQKIADRPIVKEKPGIKFEKDFMIYKMFLYADTVVKDAGLEDYSLHLLKKEDVMNHTELYLTLKYYLLCENNMTTAAEWMHIHRNTLAYRLKQIRDCIGLDINDYDISRQLLAYMLLDEVANAEEEKNRE